MRPTPLTVHVHRHVRRHEPSLADVGCFHQRPYALGVASNPHTTICTHQQFDVEMLQVREHVRTQRPSLTVLVAWDEHRGRFLDTGAGWLVNHEARLVGAVIVEKGVLGGGGEADREAHGEAADKVAHQWRRVPHRVPHECCYPWFVEVVFVEGVVLVV